MAQVFIRTSVCYIFSAFLNTVRHHKCVLTSKSVQITATHYCTDRNKTTEQMRRAELQKRNRQHRTSLAVMTGTSVVSSISLIAAKLKFVLFGSMAGGLYLRPEP
jgi:hypothetical protein